MSWCHVTVSVLCLFTQGAMGWSAVCSCGIPYHTCFFSKEFAYSSSSNIPYLETILLCILYSSVTAK